MNADHLTQPSLGLHDRLRHCRYGATIALVLACIYGVGQVRAQTATTLASNPQELIQSGAYKAAFEQLSTQESQRAGEVEFDLMLGIAANEVGQYSRAVFAFERVLVAQPNNHRARAELGRALLALGDTKAARQALEKVSQQDIPQGVRATLNEFLEAVTRVEDTRKASLKIYVEAGVGHDNNANSGPASALVAVPAFGGLVVTLAPNAVEQSSSLYNLGVGLTASIPLDPRVSLITGLSVAMREHTKSSASAFDAASLDANLGLRYRVDRHDGGLVLQHGRTEVDDKALREQNGLSFEYNYLITGFQQLSLFAQIAHLSYPDQGIRNANRRIGGATYSYSLREGLSAFGSVYAGNERPTISAVDHLGHRVAGLRLGVIKPLQNNLTAFGSLGLEKRDYGTADPLFLVTRSDRQTSLALGMHYKWSSSLRITPQLAWVRNLPNISINQYYKGTASLTVRKEF